MRKPFRNLAENDQQKWAVDGCRWLSMAVGKYQEWPGDSLRPHEAERPRGSPTLFLAITPPLCNDSLKSSISSFFTTWTGWKRRLINPYNVSTWLVAWYSIVAKISSLFSSMLFGGASIVASFFQIFLDVFWFNFFSFCFPIFEFIFKSIKNVFNFSFFYWSFQMQGFPNN